jgi:hypothetical protein
VNDTTDSILAAAAMFADAGIVRTREGSGDG